MRSEVERLRELIAKWRRRQAETSPLSVCCCGIVCADELEAALAASEPAPMTDKVREAFRAKADRAYCDMIDQSRKEECLGYAAKLEDGSLGGKELEAHCKMREFLGMHTAYAEAAVLAASEPSAGGGAIVGRNNRPLEQKAGDAPSGQMGTSASDLRAKLEALRETISDAIGYIAAREFHVSRGQISGSTRWELERVRERLTAILEGE